MTNAKSEEISNAISFVQEVESRPCLWNYELKSYSKAEVTSLAWKEIAEKFKDTELNCREKWKNIRCAFVRSLRISKSASGSKTKKKYYLADSLSFLLPYLRERTTSGNFSKPTEQDNREDGKAPSVQSSELQTETDDFHWTSFENQSEHVPVCELPSVEEKCSQAQNPAEKRANLNTHADNAFAEWLHSKKNNPHRREKDSDLLFFESLLPDLKQLDNQRKRRFKADVLQLLNSALDECEGQTPMQTSKTSTSTNTDGS